MNELISKAGSNRESKEAFKKSQACPLITWLLRLEAARSMNPNWDSQIRLDKGMEKSIEQASHPNVRDKTRNSQTELQATTGA